MKFTLLTSSTALFLAIAACSNTAPTVPTGEGGTPGSGGSTGTGGVSSGGSTGTGGSSSTGTGGSSSTGGSTGTGGSVSSGGSTGTGESVSSGGTTGAGGSAGSGGSTGAGGSVSSGGNKGSGGASSSGGATGMAGSLGNNGDYSDIVGSWDGALDKFPCTSLSNDGYDCPNACPGGNGKTTKFTYPISGTPGTIYNVTFEAKGIVEVYPYTSTTFPASYTNPIKGNGALNNLFTIGGTQAASGNGNDYNTYEIDVSPAVAGLTNVAGTGASAYNVYYLNGVPANESPHVGSDGTQHLTFSIDDVATIKVPAGDAVTFGFDSNCVEGAELWRDVREHVHVTSAGEFGRCNSPGADVPAALR